MLQLWDLNLQPLPSKHLFVFKTCLEDVFNTSSAQQFFVFQDVLKTYLEDVSKTCLEDVFNTSWKQTKCLLGISV